MSWARCGRGCHRVSMVTCWNGVCNHSGGRRPRRACRAPAPRRLRPGRGRRRRPARPRATGGLPRPAVRPRGRARGGAGRRRAARARALGGRGGRPVPVQLGGGVRSPRTWARCSRPESRASSWDGGVRVDAAARVRVRPVAVAIDVAGGIVRTNGWLESTELTTARALERCAEAGVATVICTAIDRDGTRSGPDLELLREVRARFAGACSPPVGSATRPTSLPCVTSVSTASSSAAPGSTSRGRAFDRVAPLRA